MISKIKDMREEIKWFLYAVVLGTSLISYAHQNFASKDVLSLILDRITTINERLNSIEVHLRND